jgi:hypothetical protein
MVSLVAGMPGVGKSLFGYHVVANVSRTGAVIYSTREESLTRTARARLEAADANLENVYFWTPELPRDLAALEQMIAGLDAQLVVIDPIASHLSVSLLSDQKSRRALDPLSKLADRRNVAVLLVSHTVKHPRGTHPIDAIGGSGGGLRAVARIAYVFGRGHGDERVLACVKSNVGPEAAPYQFEVDARIMLDLTSPNQSPESKRAAATEWLIMYLLFGPRPVSELKEDAELHGHSWGTVRRAADDLRIIRPAGGPNSVWELPSGLSEQLGARSRYA